MHIPRSILQIARKALINSEVYRTFARERGVTKIPKLCTSHWFQQLPVASKETYVRNTNLGSLFTSKEVPEIVYASSGSSGLPTFWFRDQSSVADGERIHQIIFQHIYKIKPHEPTLVIVTFSMGLWIAGLFTADACRALHKKNYRITTITPGIDKEEALVALRTLKAHFKHVIIAGYPAFVLDLLREISRDATTMHPSMFLLTAGDKFSEEWRDEALSLIGKKGEYHRVNNLYGSADACSMAFETPRSIALRRAALRDGSLKRELFGEEGGMGGVYQFLPDQVFFEESPSGELIITKHMPLPLIRYNIHDKGKVHVPSAFRTYKIPKVRKGTFPWDTLPMVSVTGRTDVAVTLYALNIYPEHISGGLPRKYCTGSYHAETYIQVGKHSERLVVDVELLQHIHASADIQEEVAQSLTHFLVTHNTEFRKLKASIGEFAIPMVRVHTFGTPLNMQQNAHKALLQIMGKKPKMVIYGNK